MPVQVQQIIDKVKELWSKLTKKQRIIGISTTGAVILTLIILIVLLNQVQYEKLTTFEDTATAKAAIEILSEQGISYKLDEDNVTVNVDVTRKQDAVLALTDSDFMSEDALKLADLLTNDLSTTSSDRSLKKNLYMQSRLASDIVKFDGVDKASVLYFPTDNNYSILQAPKDISCSVMVNINENFSFTTTPESIATYVAFAIGNATTDSIKVIDQHGNLLFGGDEEDEDTMNLNVNLAYKKTVEKWYNDKMFELAIKNGFSDAEIVCALDVNCDKTSVLYTEYLAGEGLEQGLYSTYTRIQSESSGGGGDIPGTDSNDETDYYIQTSSAGNSSYDETNITYIPSQRVTNTTLEWGVINRDTSSLAIVLTNVVTRTEEELEILGLLEGTTFDEYVLNNSDRSDVDIPEAFYKLFSDASGIPLNNISIRAYSVPNYIARERSELDISLILEILLAVLIIGLLAFVVFRATRADEVVETEPELSVERLLATTRENQSLEDIEFGEKSETRKMIEKYIDENAEAVAALLRNWLNDDGWE